LWIVRDGTLKVVTITLVQVDGDSALVRQEGSALTAGDHVIISPLASISDGMPVTTEPAATKTVVPQTAATQATATLEVKP